MTAASTIGPMRLNTLAERAFSLLESRQLAWLIIALGVAVRAAEYFRNPALYVDEGSLALNILNRSFAGLLAPLDYNQASPVGFLLLEKVAVVALGGGELALRLPPFLFSIAALLLFYRVARRTLSRWAVPVALLFFASSSYVIHYAAQLKQYSSDIASTLLIALIALVIQSEGLTARRVGLFAITGCAAVWLSHPSVFVLVGVGTTLAFAALKRKDWSTLWRLGLCYLVWLASFVTFYLVSLRNLGANQTLETSWQNKGTFMPLPPASLSDFRWFARAFVEMFANPLGLALPIAAGVLFLSGCVALFFKDRVKLFLLISPILFTLAASGFHKYPFGRRLLLFLAPLLLLTITAGIQFILENAKPYCALAGFIALEAALYQLCSGGTATISPKRLLLFIGLSAAIMAAAAILSRTDKKWALAPVMGSLVLAVLLAQPAGGAVSRAVHREARDDMRPALRYIKEKWQPGDSVYVYHHIRQSFLYYAPKYGFDAGHYQLGRDARVHWWEGVNDAYDREMDGLRGKGRVWALFSLVRSIKGVNEEDYIVRRLDSRGQRLGEFKQPGVSVYLYQLNDEPVREGN